MKFDFSFCFPIVLIGLLLFSCQPQSNDEESSAVVLNQAPQNPFLGSWEFERFSSQDTSGSYEGRSIIIFGEDYYSWMASPSERKSFERVSEPTEEELKEAFNTFTAFTGPYEFSDSTITMTRQIVKRPNWMNPPRVDHYYKRLFNSSINSKNLLSLRSRLASSHCQTTITFHPSLERSS